MAETFKQILTREQLDNGIIPSNTVMVEMVHTMEGFKTKTGVIVGFNTDVEYDDESDSHAANMTEVYGKVYRCPQLYYNTKDHSCSMPWDCDMELQKDDIVFFNIIESKNAVEIECEGITYKLIPYRDLYCAKRAKEIIMLNGYVLLEQIYKINDSEFAVSKEGEVDKTRGIVRYVGEPNREYLRKEYVDFKDLSVGDEVLLSPGTPMILLERKKFSATLEDDKLFWVVQRRRIALILSKDN